MSYQTVRGMRDFLPEQARKKQFIEDLCRRTFEKYGFEPLQSPIVEDFALLAAKGSGGEAIKEEIYYFKDKGNRELGMRYDLTVPLGRIVASNPQLQRPFKRYCIGTVYRYDRPQAKRYREFTQADFDIAGPRSALADFEIIQVAADIMRGLGLEFKIKINNKMLLEELCQKCGVPPEKIKDAFRIIDKMDKSGEKEVRREFSEKRINDEILDKSMVNSFEQVSDALAGSEAVKELSDVLELAKRNGIPEVAFELSLARGLEYYTGNVFEVSVADGPSVCGGGRYDNLVELYGGQPTPAVGASFGIDRLFDTLEQTLVAGPNTDIFIIPFSVKEWAECTRLGSALRRLGLCTEVELMGRSVKKSVEYANRRGIPFIAVLGENEIKSGKVKVKEMSSGEEKEFALDDVKGIAGFCGK